MIRLKNFLENHSLVIIYNINYKVIFWFADLNIRDHLVIIHTHLSLHIFITNESSVKLGCRHYELFRFKSS